MAEMKPMTAKPLSSFSREWASLPQHMVPIARQRQAREAAG